jgi:hypothetical protein
MGSYINVMPQLWVREVDSRPPMIWQGCFQSFIKRVVKILWAMIAIPKNRAIQELPSRVVCK